MTQKVERNTLIDLFRGCFVILIFFGHASNDWKTAQLNGGLFQAFQYAGISICYFFVISGFLISASCNHLKSEFGSHFFRNVLIFRQSRIWPLFFVSCLLCYLFVPNVDLKVFLVSITFLYGFFMMNPAYLPNPPAWTLFSEEVFYLLMACIYKYLNLKRSFYIFIFTILLQYIWYSIAKQISFLDNNLFIERFFFANSCFLFMGVFFYFLSNHAKTKVLIQKYRYFLEIAFLALGVFTFSIRLNSVYFFYILLVACFLCLTCTQIPNGIFAKFNFQWLQNIGRHCYFIYLMQKFNFMAFRDLPMALKLNGFPYNSHGAFIFSIFQFFVIWGIANLSYRYFEKPIMLRIRKKYSTLHPR